MTALPASTNLASANLAFTDWIGETEPRPRDFSARIVRKAKPAGHKPIRLQRRWTLGVAALSAVALPAFAAPGGWDRFSIGDAVESEVPVQPMPFEQAGSSFPGSAFYYLRLDDPAPVLGEGIHSDAEDATVDRQGAASPIARAMRIDNSGVDRSRALHCLTAAIYYEAASEPDSGQRAVAQVVLNRVAHPSYPNTVCGVVYQGSERSTGCQFSFTCDGSLARRPVRMFWDRAESVARAALGGYVYAPAGLATHYHTTAVSPYWAPSLHYLSTIGAHRFYSFRGAAGSPATFRFAYLGGEPVAAPHPRDRSATARTPDPALDPVMLQKAYSTVQQVRSGVDERPAPGAAPEALPTYSRLQQERGGDAQFRGDKLPEATGIRSEYANSGRWIGSPGT